MFKAIWWDDIIKEMSLARKGRVQKLNLEKKKTKNLNPESGQHLEREKRLRKNSKRIRLKQRKCWFLEAD